MKPKTPTPQVRPTTSSVDVYHFGCDYVRFNAGPDASFPFFESLFFGLSLNSPDRMGVNVLGVVGDLHLTELRSKRALVFSVSGDAVFCLEKILEGGQIRTVAWTFTFYSSFFYVKEAQSLLPVFLKKYGERLTVSRVDLCLDLSVPVNLLYRAKKTHFEKKHVISRGGQIETFYLGSKTNNKKYFIRVYNKKLDSAKKGKFHLFLDYLALSCVSRIELQSNVEGCKEFGIKVFENWLSPEVSPEDKLWQVFSRACRSDRGTFFYHLRSLPSVIVPRKKRSGQSEQVLDELPYARTMLGYAQRLSDYGFDVLGFLASRLRPVAKPLIFPLTDSRSVPARVKRKGRPLDAQR